MNYAAEGAPKKRERIWFKEYANWNKLICGDWSHPEGCDILDPKLSGR